MKLLSQKKNAVPAHGASHKGPGEAARTRVTRGSWAVIWMINPTEEPLEVTVVLAVGVPAVY